MSRGVLLALLGACAPRTPPPESSTEPPGESLAESPAESPADLPVPRWDDAPCAGLDPADNGWAPAVAATWRAQDALSPLPSGGLAVVGSSSVRRWERAFEDLAPWGPVQRGFGGAWMADLAALEAELVAPYTPQAVLVFAGTNDVAGGSSADEVLTRYRCLVERTVADVGNVPILYIGITPTPARWDQWAVAAEVNAGVQALGQTWPTLRYIDVPAAFLRTGEPPDAALFVDDGLHLSAAGYALWTAVVLPALAELPTRPAPANPQHPAAGARVLVDLGPSNAEDGAPVSSPDAWGQTWNSWHPVDGGAQLLPGEHLALVDSAGQATGMRLVLSGGFLCNGLQNGGLRAPDPARLGQLAVAEATQDYVYVDGPDNPGALALTGLDPARRYTLRLFASRDWGDEVRTTRYTARGGHGTATTTLQTSGRGLGAGEQPDGNVGTVAELADLQPDAWGQLALDVAIEQGTFAYLALLELEVQ